MISENIKLAEEHYETCMAELETLTDEKERKAKLEEAERLSRIIKDFQEVMDRAENDYVNNCLKEQQIENDRKNKKWEIGIAAAGLGLTAVTTLGVFWSEGKLIITHGCKDTVRSLLPKFKR